MQNRQQRRAARGSEPVVVALRPQHRQAVAVVPLIGVHSTADLGQGVPFGNCMVTNNRAVLHSLVDPYLEAMIGALESDAIRSAEMVVYRRIDDRNRTPPSGEDNLVELLGYLTTARRLVDSLWYIRDSAARFDLGFLNVRGITSSNSFHAGDYCRADGTRDTVAITAEEIMRADTIRPHVEGRIAVTGAQAEAPRFTRADYFLQAARSASDVGVKVAFYCTCLEALLAPRDTTELTYRLAERAAIIASERPGERRETFSLVREAYAARSRVIHGDVLSDRRVRELPQVAVKLDDVLRRLLNRLLADAALMATFHEDRADDYFADAIFGGATS